MSDWYTAYLIRNHGPLFTGVLVPCPFCGGTAEQGECGGEYRGKDAIAVGCSRADCNAHGPMRLTNIGAANAWNRAWA